MRIPFALLAVLCALPAAVDAQQVLTLAGGFTPDPQTMQVKAGGELGVAEAGRAIGLGDMGACTYGYVAGNAVGIQFTPGSLGLYIYAEADGDTMLLIQTPGGDVLCDDDSHGDLNPLVRIPDPESGLYVVFVGSFSSGAYEDATLFVSELGPDLEALDDLAGLGGDGAPDFTLDPEYGAVELSTGFQPDPYTVALTAGGAVDVDVSDCSYGYVSDAPSVHVRFTTSGNVDLHFYARSDADTMILINTPGGSWICDDDSLGESNPQVTVSDAEAGRYDVWVGTYGSDRAAATLHVSGKAAK